MVQIDFLRQAAQSGMVPIDFLRHDSRPLQHVQGVGEYQAFYDLTGYGYVLAWSISFYPQLLLNWRRKSTAGMSIGFLWYNILGFTLYLVYTSYAPDCTIQDQMYAGHALFITAITLMQVPLYATGKQAFSLGDFPRLHGKVAALLLMVLDICLMLHVGHFMSMLSLLYACGWLKTTTSLIKYSPQFYLNWERKSTLGFAIGAIFFDLAGGVLMLTQQAISCKYDYDNGTVRPVWTWEPFSGNCPKLFLGLITIFYDLAFLYQHFVMYPAASDSLRLTETDLLSGKGLTGGDAGDKLARAFKPAKAMKWFNSGEPKMPGLHAGAAQTAEVNSCLGCGAEFAPFAANCRKCGQSREVAMTWKGTQGSVL